MAVFTDRVIEEILTNIGSRPPESGGALFGCRTTNMICKFVFDPTARTTGVVYYPSEELITEKIPQIEKQNDVVFKGIIHSHPGLESPSCADLVAVGNQLRKNGHLGSVVVPIITFNGRKVREGNTYAITEECELHLYRAYRSDESSIEPVNLIKEIPKISRVKENIEDIAKRLFSGSSVQISQSHGTRTICDVLYNVETLHWDDYELSVYFSGLFPVVSPLVCLLKEGEDELDSNNWLQFPWGLGESHVGALSEKLSKIFKDRKIIL